MLDKNLDIESKLDSMKSFDVKTLLMAIDVLKGLIESGIQKNIAEPPPPLVIRKRGRPKTQTEESKKEYRRAYMRSYMADRRAKIKLSESE